jgi:hypothetical protein
MTPEQMLAPGTAFATSLRVLEEFIPSRPTRQHLHAYGRGLLSDLAHQSVEPIALACTPAVRTLRSSYAITSVRGCRIAYSNALLDQRS